MYDLAVQLTGSCLGRSDIITHLNQLLYTAAMCDYKITLETWVFVVVNSTIFEFLKGQGFLYNVFLGIPKSLPHKVLL